MFIARIVRHKHSVGKTQSYCMLNRAVHVATALPRKALVQDCFVLRSACSLHSEINDGKSLFATSLVAIVISVQCVLILVLFVPKSPDISSCSHCLPSFGFCAQVAKQ
jgi:hypothetical protein